MPLRRYRSDMLYALMDGIKVRAQPHQRACCPNCSGEVLAKCGAINIWHWAHLPSINCDSWTEGETAWHLLWKSYFPPERVEVPISKDGRRHVADIITQNGTVLELQASPISVEEIQEREQFYKKLVWLFDVAEAVLSRRLDIRYKDCRVLGPAWPVNRYYPQGFLEHKGYQTFRWYHAQKHIAYTSKPTWLDLGDGRLFDLRKMHLSAPCGGWGYLRDKYAVIGSWGGTTAR